MDVAALVAATATSGLNIVGLESQLPLQAQRGGVCMSASPLALKVALNLADGEAK